MKSGIRQLKAGQLQVDPIVQREFKPHKARKLSEEWEDTAVGVLVVSKRADGSHWIIEGQHRWAAGLDLFGEDYKFTCEVHTKLSLEDEAMMFLLINNNRTKPTPYDRFRIALVAGHADELAIDRVAQKLDLTLGPTARSSTIGAIEALRRILQAVDEEGLHDTIDVAIQAFGRHAETYDADMLQAIAALLEAKPDLDQRRLAKVLTKSGRTPMTVNDWKRAGAQIRKHGGSSSRRLPIARLIGEAYDRGLADQKKIEL
jgi:hypothetical protein